MTTLVALAVLLLVVLVVALVVLPVGPSPTRLYRRRLERAVARAGLVEREVTLGPDVIQFWEGGAARAPDARTGVRTVVLVHGFGGDALWQWTEQIRSFARDHRLVVPNLLGFGASRSAEPRHEVEHQVEALVALLDHLGERDVDLVGLSYGGIVSWALAAQHPDRVRRLVLVDAPGPDYGPEALAALCERFGVDDAEEVFVPRDRQAVRTLIELAWYRPPRTPGFVLDDALRVLYASRTDELRALLAGLRRRVSSAGADVPPPPPHETLVIWGRHDPVFPLEIAERLVASLDGHARLAVIEDAVHAPNLEHAARFNALVREFLGDEAPDPDRSGPPRRG